MWFHINGLNQNLFFQWKFAQKTVETSQPQLNVLPTFIIAAKSSKKFLVHSIYVKQRSLLSLHLRRTLVTILEALVERGGRQRWHFHLLCIQDKNRQISACFLANFSISLIYKWFINPTIFILTIFPHIASAETILFLIWKL